MLFSRGQKIVLLLLLHNYERDRKKFLYKQQLESGPNIWSVVALFTFCWALQKHFDSDDKEVGGGGVANVIV